MLTAFTEMSSRVESHVKQIANPLNDRLQIKIFVPKMMFPVQGFRCMSRYRLNKINFFQNLFVPLATAFSR